MVKILILGGFGFVGSSLCSAIDLNSSDDITITSSGLRDGNGSAVATPRYCQITWDIRQPTNITPNFDVIIHAATPASAEMNTAHPEMMFSQNVSGMANVIEFASRHEKPPIVLFTSSGAVYGDMPSELERFPEVWSVAKGTQELSSAYARGKIEAELMLQDATQNGKCIGLIARMFAFSGIHLPIDRHFAIGNFVRDVVNSRAITIRSDGSSIRSYMDGKDMATWLLRIIEAGSPGEIYHVGSERSVSIGDLASLVAERYQLLTDKEVSIETLGKSSPLDGVSRYVPSTKWTREKLNLKETVSLELSIDQMIINALVAS